MPDGTRRALHNEADCLYTAARSALVLEAEHRTVAQIGPMLPDAPRKERDNYGYEFTKVFSAIVDKLAAPLLKQSSNGAQSSEAQSARK